MSIPWGTKKPKFKMNEEILFTLDGKETEGTIIGIYGITTFYYDIKVPNMEPVNKEAMPRRINIEEKELRRKEAQNG